MLQNVQVFSAIFVIYKHGNIGWYYVANVLNNDVKFYVQLHKISLHDDSEMVT